MNLKINKRSLLRSQRGLTLVEIIVVLIILGILFTFLIGGVFGQGQKAQAKITEGMMMKLKGYVNQYLLQYNSLPTSLVSLYSCADSTSGSFCVPVAEEKDTKDAWGTPFIYTVDGSGRTFTVKSLGADRREGGTGVNGDPTLTGP